MFARVLIGQSAHLPLDEGKKGDTEHICIFFRPAFVDFLLKTNLGVCVGILMTGVVI